MMKYYDVVYGNYAKSNYPEKLVMGLFKTVSKILAIEPNKYRILDIGCGDGTYVKEFHKLGFESYGIDSDILWQHNNILNTVHFVNDLNGIPISLDFNKDRIDYPDNYFNFVFSKSVIEHVANTDHFLRQIYRILKPGERVIILTPSWEYNYRWFYDDPTHVKPFHRKGLQDALRLAGFKNVNVQYFYHLPFMWTFPKIGNIIVKLIRLLPDDWRWKDWEQQKMNVLIRFSKEVQLFGVGTK